jgi:LPXTG-motif cell wall-anchored protein
VNTYDSDEPDETTDTKTGDNGFGNSLIVFFGSVAALATGFFVRRKRDEE